MPYKIPVSVLVVIHTPEMQVLLLERARNPGYWQSVTGSIDHESEPLCETALREVREETGIEGARGRLIDTGVTIEYEIFEAWRHRYAPGVTRNTEHWFSLEVPTGTPVRLAPEEHTAWQWCDWREAARRCFSPSNAEAIRALAAGRGLG